MSARPRALRTALCLALCVVLAIVATRASAQAPSALDDSVRAVATQLRCPVCQGESIQESPAELAKAMRQIVREQLAAGRSSEEVKAYFVSKYGEWILLKPKIKGVNVTIYVLPFLLLLGGAALILVAVKRWTHSAAGSSPDSPQRIE